MKMLRNKKGFTLVEILVVLAVLAILIAVAVPALNGALKDAQEKTVLADARAAYIAYLLVADNEGLTCADIEAIVDNPNITGLRIGFDWRFEGTLPNLERKQDVIYTDNRIPGKYVRIILGKQAMIEEGSFDEAAEVKIPVK